jgi:uncharacterized caspase-like protein
MVLVVLDTQSTTHQSLALQLLQDLLLTWADLNADSAYSASAAAGEYRKYLLFLLHH